MKDKPPGDRTQTYQPEDEEPASSDLSELLKRLKKEAESGSDPSSSSSSDLVDNQVNQIKREQIPDLTTYPPLGGRYRILKEVPKRGGQAWVYKAVDEKCENKPVAIKVVFQCDVSAAAIILLIEEVQKTVRMPSDHFVHVYECGLEKEFAWYAMEWLPGQTLRDEIDSRKNAIPWDEAFGFAAEVLKGLEICHAQSMYHGDIKPGNVWLMPPPSRRVKIIDLGLARCLFPLLGKSYAQPVGGTLRYLPVDSWPRWEGAKIVQDVDHKTDIFSLGVTLGEMLSGRKPFADIEDSDLSPLNPLHPLKLAHEQQSVGDDLLMKMDQLPKVCREIVAKATHRDPAKRYQSAKEFREALQRALTPAKPPANASTRRYKLVLGVLLTIVLLGMGAVLFRGNNEPIPSPVPFKGFIEFRLTARGGKPIVEPKPRQLGDPNTPSLKKGDRGQLHAKLTEGPDAHFYIVWIDSTGKAKPSYPAGWTWEELPPVDKTRPELLSPTVGDAPVADTPTGLESIVWLVRDRPLSRQDHDKLKAIFTNPGLIWKQDAKDFAEEIFLIENGRITRDRGALELKDAGVSQHPVLQLEAALVQVKDQKLARYSRAVCYPFINP